MVSALYTDTESAVKYDAGTLELLSVLTGIREGCVLVQLFSVCMYRVMVRTVNSSSPEASFDDKRFTDHNIVDVFSYLG